MTYTDQLLDSRIADRRAADLLFADDRRRHDRRALEHYRKQLAAVEVQS